MNSTIDSIIVKYKNGEVEQFPEALVDGLAAHQGDHITLAGFIEELFHGWDKEYALKKQGEEFAEQKSGLIDDYVKSHLDGLNRQRGKQIGLLWDKWAEVLPDFPYHHLDIVPIPQPGDRLCFNGMVNDDIKEIVWLEYQIKNGVYEKRKKQIKRCLDEGKFKYELYIPPKHWL